MSEAPRELVGRLCEALVLSLVVGATAVVQHTRPGRGSAWLLALIGRKPRKLAAVAWAVAATIVSLNAWLLVGTFRMWLA